MSVDVQFPDEGVDAASLAEVARDMVVSGTCTEDAPDGDLNTIAVEAVWSVLTHFTVVDDVVVSHRQARTMRKHRR